MFSEFIIYVKDQQKSTAFYISLLQMEPSLHVPGMTEFDLSPNCKLGIMPESSIKKILQHHTPDPASGNGIPRCELYLYVPSPTQYYERALELGAIPIEKETQRNWNDSVAYCADPDGHILAFAKKM